MKYLLFITALLITTNGFSATKKAPDFKLKDQNGKEHSLQKYLGKYVVLEWTNYDCPFVMAHYDRKTMVKTYNKFKSKNVVWLSINSTHYNKPADAKKWVAKKGIQFAQLQDPSGAVGKKYGAKTTPHMFVVNPRGEIIYSGAIDDDKTDEKKRKVNYVEQVLNQAMSNSKISPSSTKPYGCSVKYKS